MSHSRWRRHADDEVAIDDLLDAAGRAFAELGVANVTMIDIAGAAGCSRATLYRYFPNQEALHLGFVHRATLRIARKLADERNAGASSSLTDRILGSIAAVRADPLLSVWFEPENLSVPMKLSRRSDLLREMSVGVIDQANVEPRARDEAARRGEWLLRSIVSLLAMPGEDEAAERAMVESFVVPVLITELDGTGIGA